MDSFNSTILHVIEEESFLVKVVISCKFKTDDTICHFVHVAVASGSGGHLLPSSSQFTFTFTYKVNLRDMKYNLNLMQNLENIAVLRLGFALQLRITIWKEHPQPATVQLETDKMGRVPFGMTKV